MKYLVLLDMGVDVAGQHFAHGATIDSDALAKPEPLTLGPEVTEEEQEKLQTDHVEGVKQLAAADVKRLAEEGLIVEEEK